MTAPIGSKKKQNMIIQYIPGNMITVNTSISNNDLSTEQQKTLHTILFIYLYLYDTKDRKNTDYLMLRTSIRPHI